MSLRTKKMLSLFGNFFHGIHLDMCSCRIVHQHHILLGTKVYRFHHEDIAILDNLLTQHYNFCLPIRLRIDNCSPLLYLYQIKRFIIMSPWKYKMYGKYWNNIWVLYCTCTSSVNTRCKSLAFVYFDVTKFSFISFVTFTSKHGDTINAFSILTWLGSTLINIDFTVYPYIFKTQNFDKM